MGLLPRYPPTRLPEASRQAFVDDQIVTMVVAMRRLAWLATALFLIAGVRDLVVQTSDARVVAWRIGCTLVLALVVTAFHLASSRRAMAALAPLFMAAFSIAVCGVVVLDPARLAYSTAPLTLALVLVGLLWTRPLHLLATQFAVLVPGLGMLALVGPPMPDVFAVVLYLLVGLLLGLSLHWYRMQMAVHLFRLRESLLRESRRDALTGVLNRGGWDSHAEAALERAVLAGQPVSLAFLDLDHFKRVNDVYGHAVGDEVLERVAAVIRSELRESDLVARLGGEEFVLMLVGADRAEAGRIAERIREAVATAPVPVRATLSAGVAQLSEGERLEGLMHRADLALLRAKQTGRDRVVQGD